MWLSHFEILPTEVNPQQPIDGHGMKEACHLDKAFLSFIRQETFPDKGFSSTVVCTRIPNFLSNHLPEFC